MNCRDILTLQYANQFRLIAGDQGLGNEISWVHYLESIEYIDWLRGGELVITTGLCTGDDPDTLCEMAEKLMEKGAAGLVVSLSADIPRVPDAFARYCDTMDFPLFEVVHGVRIVDISKSVCTSIVHQQKRSDDRESILLELIHGVRLSDKRLQKLSAIGFTSDKTWRLICIQIHYQEKGRQITEPDSAFYNERLSEDYVIRIKKFIQRYLQRTNRDEILFSEEENIFWLTEDLPDTELAASLNDALYNVKVSYPGISIRAGVSEIFSDVKNLRTAVTHAVDTLKMNSQKHENVSVSYYDDMIEYRLFRSVPSTHTLEKMSDRILKELLLPENEDLLNTLVVYLDCDCSAKRTAEIMFLHSNTLHYRIHKIENILHRSLKKNEDLFDVMLAVKMYAYIQNQL